MVMSRMTETGQDLKTLASVMQRLPQVMINVSGVDKDRSDSDEEVLAAVAAEEAKLGSAGRVLLRPSGTEPLVRVMVEAASAEVAHETAERLAGIVRERLSL
jgi:phosphoglucosamine mutase